MSDYQCYCHQLYAGAEMAASDEWMSNRGRAPWGCQWFVIWKKRVEQARALGQRPLVVYFEGMAGDEEHGLGNSQKGEVRWMHEQGIEFDELDVRQFEQKVVREAQEQEDLLYAANTSIQLSGQGLGRGGGGSSERA